MAALLLAAAFFFDCMKISSAKDVSSAPGCRNYNTCLAHKQTIE